MSPLRALAGIGIAAVLLVPLSMLSTAPMPVHASSDAVLRVSIGARPERIETCREQSDEELAKVAPQMRQRVVCEGTTARYRYAVWIGERLLDSATVRGGGLRHDRRLYVFREYALPPGRHQLRVRLDRIDTVATKEREDDDHDDDERSRGEVGAETRDERERDEPRRRQAEAVPAALALEADVALASRRVLLVTYDQNARRLTSTSAPERHVGSAINRLRCGRRLKLASPSAGCILELPQSKAGGTMRVVVAGIAAVLIAGCSAPRSAVTSSAGEVAPPLGARASDTDWPSYNRTLDGQRYSPLTQITAGNVSRLRPVCEFGMGDEGGFQTGPVVVADTMFVTTAHTTVALNAASCALMWRRIDTAYRNDPFPINRGVAYLDGRVYRGMPGGRLVALSSSTGQPAWDVKVANGSVGEFLSSAPIAWNGMVFIGLAGGD